jgi:hypothetical protein
LKEMLMVSASFCSLIGMFACFLYGVFRISLIILQPQALCKSVFPASSRRAS